MLNKIASILEKLGRKRIIYDRVDKEPYLERYYLFLKDRKWFPFNIFLHKFLKSDPDVIHDHPWNYITVIIKGGYWEYVPRYNHLGIIIGEEKLWRGAGHVRRCSAESYHRIEIESNVECWTVFIPGIKRREWGFLNHNGDWLNQQWIQNDQYIVLRKNAR